MVVLVIISVLGWIGLGITKIMNLEGRLAFLPSALLIGGYVLFIVGVQVVDSVRTRKRE